MALPIKPKDTQDNCNPISSNCVIWQGPDIPCINLCNGDSVSDVVAKMAERLCTISDQLDISMLDLSCFNPIYPTPQDFQDVTQFILNKICALENPTVDPTKSTTGCPDDCIVTIAPCFQEADFLGNLITTLPLKDYVIKIGNELCTIISSITTINSAIADLETRVTYIEDNCCDTGPASINITTTGCIGNGVTQPVQNFLSQFETAFCALQNITAGENLTDAQDLIQNLCLTGSDTSLVNPLIRYESLSGWSNDVSNISQALNNLYVAFCDMRAYIVSTIPGLIDTVTECCGPSCADIVFTVSASGITDSKWIQVYLPGNVIPSGFNYCTDPNSNRILVYHMKSITPTIYPVSTGVNDVIDAINTGGIVGGGNGLNQSGATAGSEDSIYYRVCVELCVTDGNITCNTSRCDEFENTAWCEQLNSTVSTTSTSPTEGTVNVSWLNAGGTISTAYTVQLYTSAGAAVTGPVLVPFPATSYIFTNVPIGVYYVDIKSCQTNTVLGLRCKTCSTNSILVVGASL